MMGSSTLPQSENRTSFTLATTMSQSSDTEPESSFEGSSGSERHVNQTLVRPAIDSSTSCKDVVAAIFNIDELHLGRMTFVSLSLCYV